ncbi:hypothetical protein HNP37_003312 [Flavobacterium nitrogenifigens]|uniref:Uncharacterized protein n=2 Tax=Flavobacterium TaxID=237 RepID=A0A7W7N9A1_9FLAO|nr:hypothetical protein [Flavobacterium nitrogenifigens]MBB6388195.1 hypothetical protein [Flavobacterium notoginsengisoli]
MSLNFTFETYYLLFDNTRLTIISIKKKLT